MYNLYIPLCGLVVNIILILVYSWKATKTKEENKFYIYMLVDTLIMTLFCMAAVFLIYIKYDENIIKLTNKIECAAICNYFANLLTYIIYTCGLNNKKTNKIYLIVNAIIIFLVFITPVSLEVTSDLTYMVTVGPSVDITTICSGFFLISSLILAIKNRNKIKEKILPILILIIFIVIVLLIRAMIPEFICLEFLATIALMLMYFTLENPDVKLLNKIELAKIQAEKANEAKTDFLSSMSHEIRTPLNAIVGFSEAIEDSDTVAEAKENARDIITASNNLLEIVNGILDISKIEANKVEIINSEYDLKEETKNLVKLIKPRIGEKQVTLNTYIAPDLPGLLYGDKGKIKEIITNILTNAVKYTDKGTIDLKINCINKNTSCSLIITVEDTGRGIKPENIDKLFNKFERNEEDRNTTIEGAGLGLAITKSLVEMMGGKIIVQSVYGKGSVFTVCLTQRIISVKAKEYETIAENTKLQLENKKVLVVDDNVLNNKVSEKLLKKYGITPEICTSGYECIDLIKQGKKYDLILMDDMMPKLTGTETLHILQEMPSFKDKIVVLTANAIEGMKEKYIDAGFDDYLAKPIEKNELERVLRKYLNKEKERIEFEPIPESFYTISDKIVEKLNNNQEKDTN